MEWLAIVNRASGRGQSQEQLRPLLDQVRQLTRHIVFTEHRGHARDLAARATAFDGLVVVGGDGTLLEVLNGLDPLRQKLAIVPTGRGNSLARDLGLYPAAAGLAAITSCNWRCIDLMDAVFKDSSGCRTQSLAASTVALGYPAAVVRAAGARLLRLGKFGYAAATLRVRPAAQKLRISLGEQDPVEKRLTGFIANNTRHLANFTGFPSVCCHDGHFDAMELQAAYIPQAVHNISALSRRQFYNPVKPVPLKRATLTWDRPQELMVDGELFPNIVSVQIGVRASALYCTRGARAL